MTSLLSYSDLGALHHLRTMHLPAASAFTRYSRLQPVTQLSEQSVLTRPDRICYHFTDKLG